VRRGKSVLVASAAAVVAAAVGGGYVIWAHDNHAFPAKDGRADAALNREPSVTVYTAPSSVLFAVASATIDERALPTLLLIADDIARSHLTGTVRVEGYTDDAGPDDYNYGLSRDRADSVARWLKGNAGIPSSRILVVAYGETHFIQGNDTEAQRQANRRVVIAVDK
jgi:outer membrane protein OmpA-like peptidoglycan-associated protein